MSHTSVPLLTTGDWIDAAGGNTYWKDNFAALWPFTAAGDMAYATGANSDLAKLAKPSVDSLFKMGSSGVPSWLALTQLKGALHAVGYDGFNPGGQTFTGTYPNWSDITGATLDLTLAVTCTVIVVAAVTGYNGDAGRGFYIRAVVDGTGDSGSIPYNGGASIARNEAIPYVHVETGVAAGTRTVKLQCSGDSSTNTVERGRFIAAAFVE